MGEEPHHLPGLGLEFVHGEGAGPNDLQLAPRVLTVLEKAESEFVLARALDREAAVTDGRQVAVNRALGDAESVCEFRDARPVELSKQFDEIEQGLVGFDPPPRSLVRIHTVSRHTTIKYLSCEFAACHPSSCAVVCSISSNTQIRFYRVTTVQMLPKWCRSTVN
mgnify:CR=1 FL=1